MWTACARRPSLGPDKEWRMILLLLAVWLASEICGRVLASPPPDDPYRADRWRNGEPT